jgi:hypothetical protein
MTPPWTPFLARVRAELEAIASGGDAILEASQIEYQGDSNRGGGGFCAAGAARAKARRSGPITGRSVERAMTAEQIPRNDAQAGTPARYSCRQWSHRPRLVTEAPCGGTGVSSS